MERDEQVATQTGGAERTDRGEFEGLRAEDEGLLNCKIEGKESSDWKLIDGIDVIVHIFNPEKRKFYDLEKMWSELIPKEKILI